jgi:hypothetical protein
VALRTRMAANGMFGSVCSNKGRGRL